jgi:hypothetical protein
LLITAIHVSTSVIAAGDTHTHSHKSNTAINAINKLGNPLVKAIRANHKWELCTE